MTTLMAECRLVERERALLRAMIEATDVMLVYLDPELNFVLVNRAYAETCKMPPEEMIGKNHFALYPHAENEAIFRRVRDTGEPVFYKDKPFTFPDQPERGVTYWDWSLVPVNSPDGRVIGLVYSLRETTRYKHAELALADSEKRFRTLAAATFEGIAVIEEGRFVDANEQLLKIYGCDRQDIIGHPVAELLLPEDRERVLSNILAGRESVTEHDLVRKDGSRVTLEAHGQTMLSEGRPVRFAAVRDITERKRAEEERQKAQRLESIGLLAGGIAHDFNNILTAILGNITLARMFLPPGDKAADRLAVAEQASVRARGLAQQLLTFAKGGAPIKVTAAVPHLLREAVGLALRGEKVRDEYLFPEDLWPVEADESQLNQAISNLAINAVEAMPEGGVVAVAAANILLPENNNLGLPAGQYVRIDIKDQGGGIDPEIRERVFDPYFTTKEQGSGLGLAISFSIAKRHGGTVIFDSEPGQGSTFSLFLPASQKKAVPATVASGEVIAGTGRVLVMDDEETVGAIAIEMLRVLGYRGERVKDGAGAIVAYRQALEAGDPFDAVIADLTVPGGMGGKETVRRLLGIDPRARVIVSSGYANDPVMSDYRAYGFRGVIPKPFRLSDLSRTLKEVIGKAE
ncbi:MAG: PAS domain S-box protein [Desulfobacteraceae bacterium]|nr:PAS domain S-box protein [Desulfobacteraceae bacterium]